MSERLKIFTAASTDNFIELEKEVNIWLDEKGRKSGFVVTNRKMTMCTGTNELRQPFINCTIAIFYEI